MQKLIVLPGGSLQGNVHIPGDKSITHRALILSALSTFGREIVLHNWLQSLDCYATLNALLAMGVKFTRLDVDKLLIRSVGLYGLEEPAKILDVGNSGTSIRLLTGVLAGQKFSSQITDDASLCRRPMQRIITPLTQMGAKIEAVEQQYAPLKISGQQKLRAITYHMPMASAQVKSAILLASLYADGKSEVVEPETCRDHTEIMLAALQAKISELYVPGDISTAAFFIVGACIARGSDLFLRGIGINPTRTGIISILRSMGADINVSNQQLLNGELRGDLRVRYAKLSGVTVQQELIANAIDELPILAIAAACAEGVTYIRGAQELRYKESDRIAMLAQGLTALGIKTQVYNDGLAIWGGTIIGGEIASGGDHRIAMAFAIAALVAQQPIIIQDSDNIATSFPDFVIQARRAGLLIHEESAYA